MGRALDKAKVAKNNEFYTLMEDVKRMCEDLDLKGKKVYCNCDGIESNFYIYLKEHFEEKGLKLLTATGLQNVKIVFDGEKESITKINDGRFQSDECVQILESSDVLITNPPFTGKREFIEMLSKVKEFCVILPIVLGDASNYLKMLKIGWAKGKVSKFIQPDGTKKNVGCYIWTNIGERKPRELKLTKSVKDNIYYKYDKEVYRHPCNAGLDAINVDKVKDIPYDYDGVMGVPVGFVEFYDPEKWEIFGIANSCAHWSEGENYKYWAVVNGVLRFVRLLIKKKK